MATDPVGNESAPVTETVDATAPVVSVDPINATAPITGEGEVGSTVVVTFPDDSTETVVVGDNGTWTAPNPGLADGDKVSVVATDKVANSSNPVETTIDAVAPTLNITTDNKTILALDETAGVVFAFSEAVEGFAQGNISVVGGSLSNFTTTDDITWTATFTKDGTNTAPSISMANGSYTDLVGNKGTGDTQTWTADVVAPTGTVTDVVIDLDTLDAAGEVVADGDGYLNNVEIGANTTTDLTVSLNGTSEGDIVTLYDAAGTELVSHVLSAAEAAATSYTFSGDEAVTLPTTEGETLTVKAAISGDAAGNSVSVDQAAIPSDTAIIDTVPPANTPTVDADTTTVETDVLYTTDTTPVITGTVSAVLVTGDSLLVTVGRATYKVTPAADKTWSLDTGSAAPVSEAFSPLSGVQSVEAKVVDEAGNANAETTVNEVVILATIAELIISDDLTDFNADGIELDDSTSPTGSADMINNIKSSDYGTGYLYEGDIDQAGEANAPLAGLSNDNTPTLTVKLDNELAADYQDINITRSYKDAEGNWIEDDVVASTDTSLSLPVLSSINTMTYTFTDALADGEADKEYKYEARIINSSKVTDSTLANYKTVEMELDTVNTMPVITSFDPNNNSISGTSTEDGTIFVTYNNETSKQEVFEGQDWTLELTDDQISAFLGVNDLDNYVANGDSNDQPISGEVADMQDQDPIYDGYLPFEFVDKAGNVNPVSNELYYFNKGDGPYGDLNPEDNPLTAVTSFDGGSVTTQTIGNIEYNVYTTTFSEANQTVFVKNDLDAYNSNDMFNLELGGGDDILYVAVEIEDGVMVYMGEGNDAVHARALIGDINNPTLIDLGNGNNIFTQTGNGELKDAEIVGGDGDDVVEITNSAETKNTIFSLGGGHNTIKTVDDLLASYITTSDGEDKIIVDSSSTNCDLSGEISLGDGIDKIILTNGNINNWGFIEGTTVDMGAGDDVIDIKQDIENDHGEASDITVDTGAGDDDVDLGGNIEGIHGSGIVTVNLGTGDDDLYVGENINDAVVNAGVGEDILTIKGYINESQINMGDDTDLDILDVTGNIYGSSTVNMGDGVGKLTCNNIEGGTVVSMGEGVDELTCNRVQGGAVVNMGDGIDTVNVTRFLSGDSTINLDAGDDTINLGYFNDGAGSLVDGGDGTDILNLTGSNTGGSNDISINNIEVVQLAGNGASYDLDWNDIMLSDGTNDDVTEFYINQTGSNNRIDLSGWTLVTDVTPPDSDPFGETYAYNIYEQTKDSITETLYIDQNIDIF